MSKETRLTESYKGEKPATQKVAISDDIKSSRHTKPSEPKPAITTQQAQGSASQISGEKAAE